MSCSTGPLELCVQLGVPPFYKEMGFRDDGCKGRLANGGRPTHPRETEAMGWRNSMEAFKALSGCRKGVLEDHGRRVIETSRAALRTSIPPKRCPLETEHCLLEIKVTHTQFKPTKPADFRAT